MKWFTLAFVIVCACSLMMGCAASKPAEPQVAETKSEDAPKVTPVEPEKPVEPVKQEPIVAPPQEQPPAQPEPEHSGSGAVIALVIGLLAAFGVAVFFLVRKLRKNRESTF
jgi:uncharacterized protein HemX